LHRAHAEGNVSTLAGDLARLRVERGRRSVPVDALDVDLAAAARLPLGECGAAGVANGAGDHHRLPRRRRRPAGFDGRGRVRCELDMIGAELGPGDLEDHIRDTLADLGRGAVDDGRAVVVKLDSGGAVVVEPLREAEVLEPDGEPDAAVDALAAGRVAGTSRKAERVAGQLLRSRPLERGGAAADLG